MGARLRSHCTEKQGCSSSTFLVLSLFPQLPALQVSEQDGRGMEERCQATKEGREARISLFCFWPHSRPRLCFATQGYLRMCSLSTGRDKMGKEVPGTDTQSLRKQVTVQKLDVYSTSIGQNITGLSPVDGSGNSSISMKCYVCIYTCLNILRWPSTYSDAPCNTHFSNANKVFIQVYLETHHN